MDVKDVLNKILQCEKTKPQDYQVLFLRNDSTQDVEVQEVNEVDFLTVKERLDKGESVFITSKKTQKITQPKSRSSIQRSPKTKIVTAFYA